MRWVLISMWLFLIALPAHAQEAAETAADKGFLTGFLEEKLSGLGRTVTLDGFQGALSSRATFSRLTIADADGVWITFQDGAISWNRSALLSGRVEIAELSAAEIRLLRRPSSGEATVETTGFALPELPVSVSIGQLRADRLVLAPAILGQEAVVTISGRADLAGGAGSTDFSLQRVDGKQGSLTLTGSYANATGQATLDLLVKEGPDGIAATLLNLPGKPSAELAVHGSGTFADFRSDLALSTDGQPRVTGQLTTSTPTTTAGPAGGRNFFLSLRGDIAPLLPPAYGDFFGNRVTLEAEGARRPNGQMDLSRLVLDSPGVGLSGRLSLSPERVPLASALTLRLGLPDGRDLLLPVPGGATTVKSGVLRLRYDAAKTTDWTLSGTLDGLKQPDFVIGSLSLDGKGRVLHLNSGSARIVGAMGFDAAGLAFRDPRLAQAAGTSLTGRTVFGWQQGDKLRLRQIALRAGDLGLSGDIALNLQGLDLAVDGALSLTAPDVARFSGLAGRPLSGAADITLTGNLMARSGAFDLTGTASGRSLGIAQPMADRLLTGTSDIRVSALRDRTGITLRSFDLQAGGLMASASGTVTSKATDLSASLTMDDLSVLGQGFGGGLTAEATLAGPPGQRGFSLSGAGHDLRFGSVTIDPLFAGDTQIALTAREQDDTFALTEVRLENAALSAQATETDVAGAYQLDGALRDTARLLPGFPGATSLTGGLRVEPSAYRLDITVAGPGGIAAQTDGTVARDFSQIDLALAGSGQAAVLNTKIAPRSIDGPIRFDVVFSGPPALSSLSGRISGTGLRFAAPGENLALEDIALTGDVAGGAVQLAGGARLRGGGSARLAGSVAMAAPYEAALSVDLERAQLRDPGLFQTEIDGALTLNGPLLSGGVIGGNVTLRETEITVAASAFGPAEIPAIRHVNDSAEARATRHRAGVDGRGKAGREVQNIYGLDLVLNAPARLFVRGLGLDAELGGSLQLRGTTADVQPTGQFELIRGRLSLLGKRFNLDEGVVQLLGSLVPYVRFTALADSFGTTTTILLEGPADKPEIHFTSSSDLPEEEVLSQLLFGRGLNNISAFQLAQLANAIATLTGSGGDGMISRLRKSAGLDDLDITADEDGNAALKAGKYLSDQLYGEASVGADGKSKIDLNLDVNTDLTVRGTVGTDGQTGVGILFSKDY